MGEDVAREAAIDATRSFDSFAGVGSTPSPTLDDALARMRCQVDLAGDAVLAAMMSAAEELATRLHRQHSLVDERRRAYERASEGVAELRGKLATLLRTFEELATPGVVGADAVAEPTETDNGRARRDKHSAGTPSVRPRGDSAAAQPTAGSMPRDDTPASGSPGGVDMWEQPDAASREPPGSADLAARLLGPLRLYRRGRLLSALPGAKAQRVLSYLIAERGRAVPQDKLIDLFWPSADVDTGRRNLHQVIYVIRRDLRARGDEVPLIVYQNDAYSLNPALGLWCDVDEFEGRATHGRRADQDGDVVQALAAYEEAERLYEGDYLAEAPYEEWAFAERERLHLLYLDVANRIGDLRFESGDVAGALQLSQRILVRDAADERAHRRALRCYGAMGDRSQLTRQYRACVAAMEDAYSLEPSAETTNLYAALVDG